MTRLGLIALACYLLILLLKWTLAHRAIARERNEEPGRESTTRSPVTIVQPILSGDPFLETALRTNLANAPENASFLWLVDEDDAEAQRLAARFDARVLLCPPPQADENPKSAKLQRALAHVDTEYFAVLDDDTILPPHHLDRALHALQHATLYTGLPCYLPGANLWSSLVAHFVNNNSILTYLPLPPVTINGMFYVMRTRDLRDLGGFAPICGQLCDDYALAKLVTQHGGTIRQGITPQFLRTTVADGRRYVGLMQRWFLFANVLLRDQPAKMQLRLIPMLGLPPLLFALSFFSLAGGTIPALALLAMLIARHALLRNLHHALFVSPDHRALDPQFRFNPLISIVSELLQPLHWLHASLQHTLQWRTRRILLGRDGTFSYVGRDGCS
ncbi:MAG TPA: glycosyltransferase [Thermoanaerobaculia bacterium]|nr:glycosyltransferase [Thermoanaerobaculia bacterium]